MARLRFRVPGGGGERRMTVPTACDSAPSFGPSKFRAPLPSAGPSFSLCSFLRLCIAPW